MPPSSRLISLAPELDLRLCRATQLDIDVLHPIVLDPKHQVTQLLIQHTDKELCHIGPERVFIEMRRRYWVLRGPQAIQKYQHKYHDCRHSLEGHST